ALVKSHRGVLVHGARERRLAGGGVDPQRAEVRADQLLARPAERGDRSVVGGDDRQGRAIDGEGRNRRGRREGREHRTHSRHATRAGGVRARRWGGGPDPPAGEPASWAGRPVKDRRYLHEGAAYPGWDGGWPSRPTEEMDPGENDHERARGFGIAG